MCDNVSTEFISLWNSPCLVELSAYQLSTAFRVNIIKQYRQLGLAPLPVLLINPQYAAVINIPVHETTVGHSRPGLSLIHI